MSGSFLEVRLGSDNFLEMEDMRSTVVLSSAVAARHSVVLVADNRFMYWVDVKHASLGAKESCLTVRVATLDHRKPVTVLFQVNSRQGK